MAVAVGRLAYGSAADSLWWYGWLASDLPGGVTELDRQTDSKSSGLAQHYHSHASAGPRDRWRPHVTHRALARLSLTRIVLLSTQCFLISSSVELIISFVCSVAGVVLSG